MQVTIAMAGPAEAAEFFGLLIIGGILLLLAGGLAFSWWKRSLIAAIIGLVIVLALGALMQPWTLISPPLSNDPDEAYWLVRERFVGIIWAVLVFTNIACLVKAVRHRRLEKTGEKQAA